jgi:hypothetical protein
VFFQNLPIGKVINKVINEAINKEIILFLINKLFKNKIYN